MDNIPLNEFFKKIQSESYCLVKSYNLVNYADGSDIDIFCFDIGRMVDIITNVGRKYLDEYEIKITDNGKHFFIDFCHENNIVVRFDLYGELPHYNRVRLNPAFFSSVIENYQIIDCDFGGEIIPIHIASEQDDLIIRYIEYIEYYMTRPDKVKHLDYILGKLEDTPSKIQYLDKLHYYTDFPICESPVPFDMSSNQTEELKDKNTRELLRKYQNKIDSIEERYQRLLKIASTDFDKIKMPSELIIYGAGNISKILYNKIKHRCKVEYFVDSYSSETSYEGIPIITPSEVTSKVNKTIVVVPMYDYDNIVSNLSKIYDNATVIESLEDFIGR